MRRFIALFSAIVVFMYVSPAYAIFEVLDELQQELDGGKGTATESGLEDIVQELEGAVGPTFADVKKGEWYEPYVSAVALWGIVSGDKDADGNLTGTFRPGDGVTIAEILKMALRAAQVDETKCVGVPRLSQAQNHWARSYVVCAEQRSFRIVNGNVDINRAALRGEVVGIIHDAFGDDVPPLISTFYDTEGHAYEADIAYAALLGVVTGFKDSNGIATGMFGPDIGVNRAEASKIIFEKINVQEG